MQRASRMVAASALAVVLVAACGKPSGEAQAPDVAPAVAAKAGPASGVVNVYNWSDYIDPQVLEDFEAASGLSVRYDVFDSNELLETKLLTGNSGYDLVVPSAYFLERQVAAGVFRKLDKSKLPNLANLDPELTRAAATHDADNAHSVIYMWGTTGIGYDADKIKAIMPDAPVDSWSLVFDPAIAERFKDCGISVLDDPTDMVATMLLWLGKDPNSQAEADLALAEQKLQAIRPYVRSIHSSQYIEDLANGEICIAVGYSGDVLQAKDRAADAGKPVNIHYSIPKEGALMWFDTLAIPADAPNAEGALALIDYLMKPEVAAANSNFVYFANANARSTELLEAELRDDPGIYPTPQIKARLHTNLMKSPEFTRVLNRSWTRFTTGT